MRSNMETIEFQAIVKNGSIEIPPQYLKRLKEQVRVILLTENTSKMQKNLIDKLLVHPVRIKGFRPLSREEIYAG